MQKQSEIRRLFKRPLSRILRRLSLPRDPQYQVPNAANYPQDPAFPVPVKSKMRHDQQLFPVQVVARGVKSLPGSGTKSLLASIPRLPSLTLTPRMRINTVEMLGHCLILLVSLQVSHRGILVPGHPPADASCHFMDNMGHVLPDSWSQQSSAFCSCYIPPTQLELLEPKIARIHQRCVCVLYLLGDIGVHVLQRAHNL